MSSRMAIRVCATLSLIALFTGCASTHQVVPTATGQIPSNSSRIVILRDSQFQGSAAPLGVMDNGKQIGTIGPGGQMTWDRNAGAMKLDIWNTLGHSARGLSQQTMHMCVGAGNTYNFRVYWPFTGGLKLELVSGTPVVCEQTESTTSTNQVAQGQQPSGAAVDSETKAFTGMIIRKGMPNPFKYGKSGQDITAILTVVGDAGETSEFLVFRTSTITDADGNKSFVKTDKRVEIKYSIVSESGQYTTGKNRVISIRYLD